MRVKDLYGEEGEILLDQLDKREVDFFADLDTKKKDLIQITEVRDQTKARSSDIQKLVGQINELALIFKELSILVVEQGTVLDRIDYNVEQARMQVQKGNSELQKTVKRETSSRARGVMSCLVTSIVITATLLVLKWL